jgi:hypothetical protein
MRADRQSLNQQPPRPHASSRRADIAADPRGKARQDNAHFLAMMLAVVLAVMSAIAVGVEVYGITRLTTSGTASMQAATAHMTPGNHGLTLRRASTRSACSFRSS